MSVSDSITASKLVKKAESKMQIGLSQEGLALYKKAAALGLQSANTFLWDYYANEGGHSAIDWFEQIANKGEYKAILQIADIYFQGKGMERDLLEAAKWYQQLYKLGDYEILGKIAQCYKTYVSEINIDENGDVNLATTMLEQEANEDLTGSCDYYLYILKSRLSQDFTSNINLLNTSANKGYIQACLLLGTYYAKGENLEMNLDKAVQNLNKAKAIPEAQYLLGSIYLEQRNTSDQVAEGVDLLNKAANSGILEAQVLLANYYRSQHMDAQAVEWYEKAANQGDAQAQYYLGRYYKEGNCVLKSESKSINWFEKSFQGGNIDAEYELGKIYLDKKMYKNAFNCFKHVNQTYSTKAKYELALCLLYGWGCNKDYETALALLSDIANNGNVEAQRLLGICYYSGQGVQTDLSKAKLWLKKAADSGDKEAQYYFNLCNNTNRGISINNGNEYSVKMSSQLAINQSDYLNEDITQTIDTLYMNREWKYTKMKEFSTYHCVYVKTNDTNTNKPFRCYYNTGELFSEGEYKYLDPTDWSKTVFCGKIIKYYKSGQEAVIENWENGLLNGTYVEYEENGLIRKHFSYYEGRLHGLCTEFVDNGLACIQLNYEYGEPVNNFYTISNNKGYLSHRLLSNDTPIFSSPDPKDNKTEYIRGQAWLSSNSCGIEVCLSNEQVKDYGKYFRIPIMVTNFSMDPVDLNPALFSAKLTKKNGDIVNINVLTAEEYLKKVRRRQNWTMALNAFNETMQASQAGYSKTTISKSGLRASSSAGVAGAIGSNGWGVGAYASGRTDAYLAKTTINSFDGAAAYQANVIASDRITSFNNALYEERQAKDAGYLKRTTLNPGESIYGYVMIQRIKGESMSICVTIEGANFIFPWRM